MRIIGLDIGDQWIGTALSDPDGIIATPYKTITAHSLITFLTHIIAQESIETIIVGNPITLRGTKSKQTEKTHTLLEQLRIQFPEQTFILWDERLSSKFAANSSSKKSKEEKLHQHSIAAAYILQSYLQFQAI